MMSKIAACKPAEPPKAAVDKNDYSINYTKEIKADRNYITLRGIVVGTSYRSSITADKRTCHIANVQALIQDWNYTTQIPPDANAGILKDNNCIGIKVWASRDITEEELRFRKGNTKHVDELTDEYFDVFRNSFGSFSMSFEPEKFRPWLPEGIHEVEIYGVRARRTLDKENKSKDVYFLNYAGMLPVKGKSVETNDVYDNLYQSLCNGPRVTPYTIRINEVPMQEDEVRVLLTKELAAKMTPEELADKTKKGPEINGQMIRTKQTEMLLEKLKNNSTVNMFAHSSFLFIVGEDSLNAKHGVRQGQGMYLLGRTEISLETAQKFTSRVYCNHVEIIPSSHLHVDQNKIPRYNVDIKFLMDVFQSKVISELKEEDVFNIETPLDHDMVDDSTLVSAEALVDLSGTIDKTSSSQIVPGVKKETKKPTPEDYKYFMQCQRSNLHVIIARGQLATLFGTISTHRLKYLAETYAEDLDPIVCSKVDILGTTYLPENQIPETVEYAGATKMYTRCIWTKIQHIIEQYGLPVESSLVDELKEEATKMIPPFDYMNMDIKEKKRDTNVPTAPKKIGPFFNRTYGGGYPRYAHVALIGKKFDPKVYQTAREMPLEQARKEITEAITKNELGLMLEEKLTMMIFCYDPKEYTPPAGSTIAGKAVSTESQVVSSESEKEETEKKRKAEVDAPSSKKTKK